MIRKKYRRSDPKLPWVLAHQSSLAYAVAVVGTAVAVLASRFLGTSVTSVSPFLAFYPVVLLSSAIGGTYPGMVATVLTAVSTNFFLESRGDLGLPTGGQAAALVLFLVINMGISVLGGRLRTAYALTRSSEAYYRASFQQTDIGMGRVSFTDARWLDVNDAFCRMLGYTRQEMLGTPWPEMTHPEDVDLDLVPFRRMGAGEINTYNVEKRFIHKQGHPVWARLTLSLVRNAGGHPDYEIAVIEDITERKNAEQALRTAKNELSKANRDLDRIVQQRTAELQDTIAELEQLSYSMIHDLRAPLRAIQSFGGIIAQDPDNCLTQESRQLISRMAAAADRMDHLIRDVLNYSKVLREELPLTPVDVGALAQSILETYPDFRSSDAQIRVAPNLPIVYANPAALTQCLSHLLDNAVKFAKPGQGAEIQIRGESEQSGWARIIVEDHGVGFSPDHREKVFGIFQQVRNTGGGTGMGLAIVKKAAERMGGRVGVISQPGHGSSFWVELRAAAPI